MDTALASRLNINFKIMHNLHIYIITAKTIIEDCLSHRGVVITDEDKKNLEEEGGRPKYIKQLSRMLSTQLSVCKEDDMSPMLKRRMHRQG